MAFEDNLVILRKKKFPTQQALADKMGVKKQAVSNWETGATFLGKDDLYKLAGLLGVHVSVLFLDTIDEKLTSVSEDSTRLKELSLKFHEERDRVRELEGKVTRLQSDLEKAWIAIKDYQKNEEVLRRQLQDRPVTKAKAKR